MDTQEQEKRLKAKIASLESKLDFFETEFINLNSMLEQCGFSGGIQTLKETVEEMLKEMTSEMGEDPIEAMRQHKEEEEEEV